MRANHQSFPTADQLLHGDFVIGQVIGTQEMASAKPSSSASTDKGKYNYYQEKEQINIILMEIKQVLKNGTLYMKDTMCLMATEIR